MTRPSFGRTDDELASLPIALRDGAFEGRVVLVSGAGSGIGRALAHWFARLGAKLVVCGRDGDRLASVAAALERYGCEVLPHAASIRDPEAVGKLMDAAWARFGGL